MEEKYLYQLAELVLPSEVLRYFSIVRIEKDSTLFRIYLDEKMETELLHDLHFESKGFMVVVDITDFPINPEKRNKTLCKNEMNIICIMFEETK